MSTASPLWKQRLFALALSWAWYVISGSIGLNALIKYVPYCAFVRGPLCNFNQHRSNQRQTLFRKKAPAGVTLDFHINGISLALPLPTLA